MSNERVIAGRYRLRELLGQGGMAQVYAATDTVLGRPVAVKVADLSTSLDPAAEERFRREARATASLAHPGIVTVFDTGVEDHTAYLVMELLPGRTLADRLVDEGALPIADVRKIGAQVADALAAAHAAGIVHRDIKPGNIAETAHGGSDVKVLDFGITQLLEPGDDHHPLTKTNMVMGTSEYLAPEQGIGGPVDARADLYALGCVLFALLTGAPPFRGPNAVAVLMKHQQEPLPDLASLRPDAPADLVAIVERLLAKDPADRPESATQVAQALRSPGSAAATEIITPAAAAGAATTAVLPRTPVEQRRAEDGGPGAGREPYPVAREEERSKAWIPLLLLAILALVAGGIYLANRGGNDAPANTPTTVSTTPTVTASQTQTSSPSATSPTPSVSSSSATPSGSPSASSSASPSTSPTDLTKVTTASDSLGAALDTAQTEKVLTAEQVAQAQASRVALMSAAASGNRADVSSQLDALGNIVQSASAGNNGNKGQEAIDALTTSYAALSEAVDELPFMS